MARYEVPTKQLIFFALNPSLDTGVLNIVFASGSATGAPLGGFLVDTIGWRWSVVFSLDDVLANQSFTCIQRAFLSQVPIVVLAIVSVSLALHLPKIDSSDLSTKLMRVDFGGAITLVLTVFFLLFGLDRGSNFSWADTLTVLSLGGFSIFFILFSLVELKLASEPFAPKHIIFNDSLIASFLVNMFGMASFMSMIFHISLYLQAVTEKSASEVGLWLILSVAGGLVGSLVGGLVIQATGRFYAITVGAYCAMFIGAGLIVLMTGVLMQSLPGLAIGKYSGFLGFIWYSCCPQGYLQQALAMV
jgi:predicted MFS family arabinose efflux permease